MALPKVKRIKKDREFKEIFAKGKVIRGNFLFIKYNRNKLNYSRFAVVISAKIISKAVDRNRLKRIINSTITNNIDNIKLGYDIVFVISKQPDVKQVDDICATALDILKKANFL